MIIEGETVNLRNIKRNDFDKIVKWQQNKLLSQFIGNKLPKSLNECEKRYLKASKLLNQIFGIEDKNGNFIGEIELGNIVWRQKQAELFIYIGEMDLWGRGYGFDALKTFLDYIFKTKKFSHIYLRVYEHNKRAINCYEKCGFKKRGILKFNKNKTKSDNLILMEITKK